MLTANSHFEIRLHAAATFRTQPHQLAYTLAIQHLKRIVGHDLALDVIGQEATRVVAAQTKRGLRKIVGPKGKEVGVGGDVMSHQGRTREFDHCAHAILDRHTMLAHHLACDLIDHFALLMQLFAKRNQRHHDFEFSFHLLALYLTGGFKDCATLHAGDFRKYQTQTTTTEAEHRVSFANTVDLLEQPALLVDLIEQVVHVAQRGREPDGHFQFAQFAHQLFGVRQKLMQRRIEQANGHRQANHFLKDADEVAALERQQFFKRLLPGADAVRQNHLAHKGQPLIAEEHVLRAA